MMRRQLNFRQLEDAGRDAEQLLDSGYQAVGNWDLGQCCHHLAVLMEYPLDGFPKYPFPLNAGNWVLRRTIAPRMLNRILTSGRWPSRLPTDKRTISARSRSLEMETAGVRHFTQAISRLVDHQGELHESPLFGYLDKKTLIRLHLTHANHHLSFLIPRQTVQDDQLEPCFET